MFVHFRDSFAELNAIELKLERLGLSEYLEKTSSYLSVVELGLYESTQKTYAALADRGIEPFTEAWNKEIAERIKAIDAGEVELLTEQEVNNHLRQRYGPLFD